MPTLKENLDTWTAYDWSRRGHEWSDAWGGTESLWCSTVLPRIHAFVPTGHILEIGPGFGRMTQFLKDLCQELSAVDLTERCVEACNSIFSPYHHAHFYVNDGVSLDEIENNSIDFAFSFDSLVHVEADVIESYLGQLAIKFSENGVGFIHHSNLGAYAPLLSEMSSEECQEIRIHWRSESVSAELFAHLSDSMGMQCVSQELINWVLRRPVALDCFSIITNKGSVWDRPNRVQENLGFGDEIDRAARLASLYAGRSCGSQCDSTGAMRPSA